MKILLLPGLDGTGLLFDKLLEAFPKGFDISVVSLDKLPGSTYIEQASELERVYSGEDLFLIAESYSGRIAYELCGIIGSRVLGIAFLASFVSRPSFISRFASYLPLAMLKSTFFTRWLIKLLGFNGGGDKDLVDSVFRALQQSERLKLKIRLTNIAKLTNPERSCECPAIYIKPTKDYLVSKRAVHELASVFVNVKFVNVMGGHFIAQSYPQDCAQIICNALKTLHLRQQ